MYICMYVCMYLYINRVNPRPEELVRCWLTSGRPEVRNIFVYVYICIYVNIYISIYIFICIYIYI